MPKMKTNRLTHKKTRVSARGKVKVARAGMRHNTGKKSSKRNRRLGGTQLVHKANRKAVRSLLPSAGVSL